MPVLNPNFQDREWDILYKAVNDTNNIVANGLAPNAQDRVWDLLYKLANNIGLISGGTPPPVGSVVYSVPTPANQNDFSGLPGGVIPTGDEVYIADRDANTKWIISKSDTKWKTIDTNALP